MDFVRNLITFSFCNALINKILAIIFSSIKIGFYLAIILFLKNWDRNTTKLESFCIFQIIFEFIILFTCIFMIIFSKYLNKKLLYILIRILTIIITVYLFFNFFIDICIFATIKFKEFPDLYRLDEDPIFFYSDKKLPYFSDELKKFINKDTNKISVSKINNEIFNFTYLVKNNDQIYVSDPKYFQIYFTDKSKLNNSHQKRHRFELNKTMKIQIVCIIIDIFSFFLWNCIKFKHKNLIQNRVIEKFGKKIIYYGYVQKIFFVTTSHDKEEEKDALKKNFRK